MYAEYVEYVSLAKPFVAALASLLAGLTVAVAVSRVRFRPATARAVAEYQAGEPLPGLVEKVGEGILTRVELTTPLERYNRWIALTAATSTLAYAVGLAVLLAIGGLALTLASGAPIVALLIPLGLAFPFVRLRSRANRVKRVVQRSLPEMAALMAAEMAAGNPPDRAMERAGEWGGPLSAVIHQAIEASRSTGRPVFGGGAVPGTLYATVRRYDLPPLRAFAAQIDMAARKGAAGPELMESLAGTLIIEYKDRALREAEQLDSRLALPAVLFFFLPFMVLVLVPMLVPLIKVM